MAEELAGSARSRRRKRSENVSGGRSRYFRVGVSPEEDLALRLRASALGVTVPRLLRESALAARGVTATEERDREHEMMRDLFSAVKYLGSLSNNINQIAKKTNAEGALLEDTAGELRVSLARLEQARERVYLAIARLDGRS